ncbi:MAG: hypothetical protein EBY74_07360 [Actinobacteria bacterium]|nr:hypothetical protein [Actinomycetota bacterium]
MSYIVEYMKAHLISIEQDIEGLVEQMELLDENSKDYIELEFEYNHLSGQALITRHYLSVANDRIEQ